MSYAASQAQSGDVTFGNKSQNSIWPIAIIAGVVMFTIWLLNRKK